MDIETNKGQSQFGEDVLDKKISNGKIEFNVKWPKDHRSSANMLDSNEKSRDQQIKIEADRIKQEVNGRMDSKSGEHRGNKRKGDKKKILEFNGNSKMQVPIDDMYGEFEADDKPQRIKMVRKLPDSIEYIVEWKKRANGFKPKDTVVTDKEFKKYDMEFLVKFYEDNLIYKDKGDEK